MSHSLPPDDPFLAYRLQTSQLAELILSREENLLLFDAEGLPILRAESYLRNPALDCDLVVNKEEEGLGISAGWYHLSRHSDTPDDQIEVRRAVDPADLFAQLESELVESSLLFCDPSLRIVGKTKGASRLLEFTSGDILLGRQLEEILPIESPTRFRVSEEKFEILVARRQHVTVQYSAQPYHLTNGRAAGWLVKLDAQPYFSLETVDWRAFIDHFPGLVLRLDEFGRVLFSSRQAGGLTIDEMAGRSLFDIVMEGSRSTASHFRDQLILEHRPVTGELPVYDPKAKEAIWYRISAAPIFQSGKVEILVYATDISLYKQTQEELRASRQHIRALSSQLDRAQEEERRRISRELHDELGGLLTALRLEIGSLETHTGLPKEVSDRLSGADLLIQETLTTVRRLSTQLRPQILDDLGLSAALEALLKGASQRASFEYEFHAENRVAGEPQQHLHLYRICQEAITNICRHSQADKVSLRITRPFRDLLRLTISDDGSGFDGNGCQNRDTSGLSGIAERVDLLGGTLRVESRPDLGCLLVIEVPLQAENEPGSS